MSVLALLIAGLFELTSASSVNCDPEAPQVVKTACELFAADVCSVSGHVLETDHMGGGSIVYAGTLDDPSVRMLAESGKIDCSSLSGRWESYSSFVVKNPFKGVRQALVIVGSDARGAAFGLLDFSRSIGVNPWYWWLDVPLPEKKRLTVHANPLPSPEPTVKYRGIFINDEDFGLDLWAGKTYEPGCPPVGPGTYARICELLLRLKANHLLPAMHTGSVPFYSNPENSAIASRYGIVIGTSHCEPLGYNNFTEWGRNTDGEWNYGTNRETILKKLDDRVAESAQYENIYTVALRGIHDYPMDFTSSRDSKTEMLARAISDQRAILERRLGLPASAVPQAFTPYKEVLELYDNGLVLPDDVTIVWPDDNYGYIKRLGGPSERSRSGRAGIYYHVSYQGQPHSYTWFSTTSTTLMYEELTKALKTGADRIWIVNCGDIKGCEMQTSFFLDMAFSAGHFDYESAADYPIDWLCSLSGDSFRSVLEEIMPTFQRLNWSRRPEMMGWGLRKNIDTKTRAFSTDTEFSYDEALLRIGDFSDIASKAKNLLKQAPAELYPVLFETLYYYVKGAELMNRMHLLAQIQRLYSREGRIAADSVAEEVRSCHDSLYVITNDYWTLLGGKWRHIISPVQDWPGMLSFYDMPPLANDMTPSDGEFGLSAQGGHVPGVSSFITLECFHPSRRDSKRVEIFNKGRKELEWRAETSEPWIILDRKTGTLSSMETLMVSVDWSMVPYGDDVSGEIVIEAGGKKKKVLVSVFNPPGEMPSGVYGEINGVVSIPGAGFTGKTESAGHEVRVLRNMGIEGSVAMLGEAGEPLENFRSDVSTKLDYAFYCHDAGMVDVYTYMVPAFQMDREHNFGMNNIDNEGTRYSVRIDGGYYSSPYTSDKEFNHYWYDAVQHNTRVNKSVLYVDRPGLHTLRIVCGDPGTMVQKIVIDFGGLRRNYNGPASTFME